MNEEDYMTRIYNLLENYYIMGRLGEYFRGETGEFDLDEAYHFTDYFDFVRNSNKMELMSNIVSAALFVARRELINLKNDETFNGLTDDELLIISACEAAKVIKHDENKHRAYNQADEWAYDSKKVEIHGTKQRAYERGYDSYMSDNNSSYYEFVDTIVNRCFEEQNTMNL